ncbi:MAG: TetR/AcrR family transcriptional regulator [Actinobacteria bacterium]|nr:TetR/AcrR family transcriptional regulator [Actinomycetota bacterium]
MPTTNKRDRLVDAARTLAYRQGFRATTLADVAAEAAVPLGNVYYYFRTKESLGAALVDRWAAEYKTLRTRWDALPDPRDRLLAFVEMTVANRDGLARSGCPIGTLCTELGKEGGPLADRGARIFGDLLVWLADQFRALGGPADPDEQALQLLSATEGASVLAHSLGSATLVSREGARLTRWINDLAAAPAHHTPAKGTG